MLAKLSLKNAKRSIKDYSIYILTITIIFSMLYSFQMLAFSTEIKKIAKMMDAFQMTIIFVSCIIVFVVAWLINYMNRFILEKRGRELGTYMLLGISNRKITHMFLIENVAIGSIAFVLGVIFGTFFYQIFMQIIMNVFEVPFQIKIPAVGPGLLLTAIYAILSYIISMLRMARRLKKIRICDMINMLEQNEKKHKKIVNHWVVGIIAVIFAIVGGVLFYQTCHYLENLKRAGIAMICFIISIYLFYCSISSMLIQFNINNKRRKYKKDHLFLMRNLSSKMRAMKMTLGTLALLLMIALTAFQNAILIKIVLNVAAESACPFDVMILSQDETTDLSGYDNYLKDNIGVSSSYFYPLYAAKDEEFYSFLLQHKFAYEEDDDILIMSFTDYQKLRQMKGYTPVKLEDDHYIVHGYEEVYNVFSAKENLDFTINGHALTFQVAEKEPLPLQISNVLCVVPDEIAKNLPCSMNNYVAQTKRDMTQEEAETLCNLEGDRYSGPYFRLKTEYKIESKIEYITFVFCLFYIGFIFVCIVATILAVQQLSESTQYRYRYRILSNLGVEGKQIHRQILKQLSFYFGMPLILPIGISMWITFCIQQIFRIYIEPNYLFSIVLRTLGLFLLVYVLYFIATYIGYIKNVDKNKVREE